MRPSTSGLFTAVLFLGVGAQASTLIVQQQPTVVYTGPNTVSAQPYYNRIKTTGESGSVLGAAPPRAGAGVLALALALEDRLPLSSTQLVVGQPAIKTVPGLTTPLFVMGMDEVSLNWFGRAAQGLADIGARGLVVQANHVESWRELQHRARDIGIDLMLLDGDSLAQGYSIRTYPVVLMSPELAGAYE